MNHGLRWVGFLMLAIAVIWLLRATVFAPRPIPVEVARVTRGTVEETVTNSQAATVKARLRTRVGTKVAGRVARLARREGAHVSRGEILVGLDTETAEREVAVQREELAMARANLAAARAGAVLARRELGRARALRQGEVISEEALEEAIAAADRAVAEEAAAEARVSLARASLRLAEQRLADHEIRAPFAGVVAEVLVELGESVLPGQAVVELIQPESLYVSAEIDEVDIGRIREGLTARVRFDPYPGLELPGRVVRVAPYVSDVLEQNRTLEVEVEFERAADDPLPRPGTSADVEIVLERKENVLHVPTFSIVEGRYVLVVEKGRAGRREIRTGLRNWDETEIVSGLEEGEQVITSLDRADLGPGVRVRLESASGDDA